MYVVHVIALLLSSLLALTTLRVMIRIRQPISSPAGWGLKCFTSALAPFLALAGGLTGWVALITGPLWSGLPGLYAFVFFSLYLLRVNAAVTRSSGIGELFGSGWEKNFSEHQKKKFLSSPTSWFLPRISEASYQLEKDIAFCTIPGTNRSLLCDIWRPAPTAATKLAFIYFHGSAWTMLDKDFGTRPFFKHLVAQGHLIMDVAYRLYPETDMGGMVQDVYRAIAWMKAHALDYGVDPEGIVIGGGSAGGHLSLLAAFSNSLKMIPPELLGTDLSVLGVISTYGALDLEALYYHCGQHLAPRTRAKEKNPTSSAPMPAWIQKRMGKNFHRLGFDKKNGPGNLYDILGCHPVQCPDKYAFYSPLHHVNPNAPPALIIQGEHDLITPAFCAEQIKKEFIKAEASALVYILPQTDHAFDLVLSRISPVAHTVFYATERFLALQANRLQEIIQQQSRIQWIYETAQEQSLSESPI